MNDYIQQFFGCRECAENFEKGARRISSEVAEPTDAILWLWRAHNRANRWLHGDTTEDPQQAKVQFPSYAACPLCRRAHRHGLFDHQPGWDEAKVLQYLMLFYAKENVKQDGVTSSKGTSIAHAVLLCSADV
ncbi:hypothetical protein NP493_351g04029 [Ridgeia piscesae]|uniref:Sulfhydryl oxidase n=1 Tax=Ridgeia piscesae TaxID=27915 RepID=A0AAD9L350_RIDPI|nr:hypothetical protein NP493_351g04029 [Ridgeia piscesae]